MDEQDTRMENINTGYYRFGLSLQYFIYFGVLGIFLPFFSLYCYHLGFSGLQIGGLFAAQTGTTVIFPLLWGVLADRWNVRKPVYVVCNLFCAVAWGFLLFTVDFYLMLLIVFVFGVFRAPIISFMEAFAMDILGEHKRSYGRIRAWGTIGFVAVVILLGRITEIFSIGIIIPLILAGAVLQAVSAFLLPAVKTGPPGRGASGVLPGRKQIVAFLFCAFLMLFSHGAYYGFFSIHLENLGYGNTFIGFAWALASVAEIVVMIGSSRLFSRFELEKVLIFSFFVAVVRWLMMFVAVSAVFILAAQLLHAVTYAAFHMASILYIDRLSPENGKTMGQGLNNAVSYGLGMMVGVFVCGWLFDLLGSAPLFAGSAVAAAAGGLLLWWGLRATDRG